MSLVCGIVVCLFVRSPAREGSTLSGHHRWSLGLQELAKGHRLYTLDLWSFCVTKNLRIGHCSEPCHCYCYCLAKYIPWHRCCCWTLLAGELELLELELELLELLERLELLELELELELLELLELERELELELLKLELELELLEEGSRG